jgi:hypothetical protein
VSIAVELDELRDTIEEFATDPYLLTVGGDGRAHTVAVAVRWAGDTMIVSGGNTTARNAAARPSVALLWPPPARGGFSLIVDADAGVQDNEITLRPTNAVLHRAPERSGEGV